MADEPAQPVWWIEVIKVSPGLATTLIVAVVVTLYRKEVRDLFRRVKKFTALGIDAEFSAKDLNNAIAAKRVSVSTTEKHVALRRLLAVAPKLNRARLLWVDDIPRNNRYERALFEGIGMHVISVRTTVDAIRELDESEYLVVVTDIHREGAATEGIKFVAETVSSGINRPTIAYVHTDQQGKAKPANFFGITNRPDELVHLVCDVAERERMSEQFLAVP